MPELWVYVDESSSPHPTANTDEAFWLGALVTTQPIDGTITDEALARLRKDPDAQGNDSDAKTLARGYFHASFDSKNAHSALCRSIVDGGLDGEFSATFWRFGRHNSGEYSGAGLHRMSVLLTTQRTLDDHCDTVNFVIARRQGSFDDAQIAEWPNYSRNTQLESLARWPGGLPFRVRFPRITTRATNADEPGVQICDFVLWAAQRARPEMLTPTGKNDWLERVRFRPRSGGGQEKGAWQSFAGHLGRGARLRSPMLQNDRGARHPNQLDEDELFALLREIAADVRKAQAICRQHRQIGHLEEVLNAATSYLERIRHDAIEDARVGLNLLVTAFLQLCDTLPIYDVMNEVESTRATEKRALAAGFLGGRVRLWLPANASL